MQLLESPDLSDVFRTYPQAVEPLLEYHDISLRGESPLSIGERELIAALVSGLNSCSFCFGAHTVIAETFGMREDDIKLLLVDIDSSTVGEKLKPLLKYVKKLTLEPSRLSGEDRQQVFDAGWCERALHDAVSTCALFNFMNRLVEGMGVQGSAAIRKAQQERHTENKEHGDVSQTYMNYGRRIGVIKN